jgi:hypothetical protein
MLDAVKQNGCTLCYASQALQNDCEIVDAPISNVYSYILQIIAHSERL